MKDDSRLLVLKCRAFLNDKSTSLIKNDIDVSVIKTFPSCIYCTLKIKGIVFFSFFYILCVIVNFLWNCQRERRTRQWHIKNGIRKAKSKKPKSIKITVNNQAHTRVYAAISRGCSSYSRIVCIAEAQYISEYCRINHKPSWFLATRIIYNITQVWYSEMNVCWTTNAQCQIYFSVCYTKLLKSMSKIKLEAISNSVL